MSRSCFRIFTLLLIFGHLFLPCSAPWLHTCLKVACAHTGCGTAAEFNSSPVARDACADTHSCLCRCVFHGDPEAPTEGDREEKPHREPHDCSSCDLCQAIAAPRILVSVVSLPGCEDLIEVLRVAKCADPLLGFCLPLRCRAPPFAGHC